MDLGITAVALLSGGGIGFVVSSMFSAARVAELMGHIAQLERNITGLLNKLAPLEAAEDRRVLQRRNALAKAKEANAAKSAAKAEASTKRTRRKA